MPVFPRRSLKTEYPAIVRSPDLCTNHRKSAQNCTTGTDWLCFAIRPQPAPERRPAPAKVQSSRRNRTNWVCFVICQNQRQTAHQRPREHNPPRQPDELALFRNPTSASAKATAGARESTIVPTQSDKLGLFRNLSEPTPDRRQRERIIRP